MPNVTSPTRNDQNGQSSTYFLDSVSTTSTTYTYPAQQDALTVTNKGNYPITLTVNGTAYTIQGSGVQVVPQLFTSFTISATGQTAFDALAISETVNSVQQTGSNLQENPFGTKVGQGVVSIEESFWNRMMRKGKPVTKLSAIAGDTLVLSTTAFDFPQIAEPDKGFRLYPRTVVLSCSVNALLCVQVRMGITNDPQATPGLITYQAMVTANTPWVLNFDGEVWADGNNPPVSGKINGVYMGAQTNTAGALLWASFLGYEVTTYNA